MRTIPLLIIGVVASLAVAGAQGPSGPYKILNTAKVGGPGGFDYVYADVNGRRLYVDRGAGQAPDTTPARITVFNLDTLAPEGVIPNTGGHGVAVDPKSHHGFSSSNPVTMFDTTTLKVIKTIQTEGSPDGIMFDPFNGRVHVFSHRAPNDTVINAADGSIVGTIDLGGAPEQAQSDGQGHIYVDLEDKSAVAAVDASTMKVTGTFDISAQGQGPSGLGLDSKNHILFVTCHDAGKGAAEGAAPTMVILTTSGTILASEPIGQGTDGGGFNPNTMEAFSSGGQSGTLSVIKESSPTSFSVEQELPTQTNAKTMTIDTKTDRVFLITAQFEQPTEAQRAAMQQAQDSRGSQGAQGRGAQAAQGSRGGQRGRGFGRQLVADSFAILEVGR